MVSRVNYTVVGLFVVALTAGLLYFAYWLARGYGQREYTEYYVYMSESVAGLNTDAAVKYRGVDVGTVARIGLSPTNPEEVELLLKIEDSTPVKTDTTAAINFYGVTGLAYVELKGSDRDAPLLTARTGEIPVIPSRPSTFQRMDESLSMLADKSSQMLDSINRLLGEDNLNNFNELLAETRKLARDLRGQVDGLQDVLENGVTMEKQATTAFRRLAEASDSISEMARELANVSQGISNEMTVGMRRSFESVDRLLYDLDQLALSLQRTAIRLESSPGDLLFKRSRPRPGPGEEGRQ